jgi:hypothetical protein
MIIPLLIYPLTRISKLKTHSAYHRLISWRIYGFLLLATLIFPTLFFSYSVGFTELLLQVRNLGELLSAFALPSTGVFFINYVLQKAILKVCDTIIVTKIPELCRFIQHWWCNSPSVHYMAQTIWKAKNVHPPTIVRSRKVGLEN